MAAWRHAETALAHAREPRQPLALLAALRLLGEIAIATAQHSVAQQHLADALLLADACAAPYERALTILAQAELCTATDDQVGARLLLAEVCAICAPLGAAPVLARADALTARLDIVGVDTAPYPDGLTPREVDVLRLVAEGLTNAQVADRLFISPKTIGRHLNNIFANLDVTTRTAAVRFAAAHHLL